MRGQRVARFVHDDPYGHEALMLQWAIDRWRHVWRVGLRPGSAAAIAFATACTATATGIHLGINLIRPNSAIFAPYYSATLVATLLGGASAGIVSMTLGGVAANWLFMPPGWGTSPLTAQDLVGLVLYATSSIVIIWVAENYRNVLQRLRREESTRRLLNGELAHRIKNTLANVSAIVSQTLRDHPDIREKVRARISALAATNDLLIRSDWQQASLRDILTAELKPYDQSQIELVGKFVELPPDVAMLFALVIHELTTNATKYGALSTASGRLRISWRRMNDRLEFQWIESNVRMPVLPAGPGFGTKILNSGVKPLGGTTNTQFAADGIHYTISLPLAERRRIGSHDISHLSDHNDQADFRSASRATSRSAAADVADSRGRCP
jgi:two-component sensor histidine kinase